MSIKIRQVHKDNEEARIKELTIKRNLAQKEFETWADKIPLEDLIDKLCYPKDFRFFKSRALLFKLDFRAFTTEPVFNKEGLFPVDILDYFTVSAIERYLTGKLSKLSPTSNIKVVYTCDGWNSDIRVYYKGEKK